ncbi:Fcf1-domain-containing protein [Russula earlei]|uniref:Fcf1-domain-containing protein n=1 Tax=Russula earlei TaxID=71964 RepID=A0ACC0UNX3_9AGAM|nr:Fcf1-domain-containing protein [Russula earlei]
MRQNRSKAYRKLMAMYSTSFGFRQPYQVLVDSETCDTASSQKIDLLTRMESVLVGSVKMMITQCCIHELYLKGKSHQPAVDLAKSFERRKCNHKEAMPGDECIAAVVGETNKHRYVIATQSHPLRVGLRAIPGVPIVHINRSVMILEPASDTTLQFKHRAEQDALGPSTSEKAMLSAVAPPPEPVVKKKGPKGPNPLSVKKKARKHATQEVNTRVAAARVEKVHAGNKRKLHEAEDGGKVSAGAEPRPKRRRRNKTASRPVEV